MVNTVLSRLPLCIEYSEVAYKVTLGDDQDSLIRESALDFNKFLRPFGLNAQQRADFV